MQKSKASSSRAQSAYTSASVADVFSAFQGSGAAEFIPPVIDASALNCLKLLDKKDSTTRTRALQDLIGNIIPSTDASVLPHLLSHFLEYYVKGGLLDPDWKCRMLYHNAMREVNSQLGRSIEPRLGELVPLWLTCMSDMSHREVSASASRAFDALFSSEEKRLKVIGHFMDQIKEYICEKLDSTPTSLDKEFRVQSSADSEEARFESSDRWERVVSATLGCVEFLLAKTDTLSLGDLEEINPTRFIRNTACISKSVLTGSIRILPIMIRRFPGSVSGEAQLVNRIITASAPEDTEAWETIAVLSKAAVACIPKLVAFLEPLDCRSLSLPLLSCVMSIVRSCDVSTPLTALLKILLGKLRVGMELDPRIRRKYVGILSKLAETLLLIPSCDVSDLLAICRSEPAVRAHVVSNIVAQQTTKTLDADKVGYGAFAYLVGAGVVSGDMSSVISQLCGGDIEEIKFVIDSVAATDPIVASLAGELERLPIEPMDATTRSVVASLLTVRDDMVEVVRNRLGFAEFVSLVCSSKSLPWVAGLHAPVDQDMHNMDAFRAALLFERETACEVNGVLDNGLIAIGGTEYNKTLLAADEEIIDLVVSRRVETGIAAYVSDDLAVELFKARTDSSNAMLRLLPLSESLRSRCAQWFLESSISESDDFSVVEKLFVSSSEYESLLERLIQAETFPGWALHLLDHPCLKESPVGLRFVVSAWTAFPNDERAKNCLAVWRRHELVSRLHAIVHDKYMRSDFRSILFLRALVSNREPSVDDGPAEPMILQLAKADLWSLFALRIHCAYFHLRMEATSQLIDTLLGLIEENHENVPIVNAVNAVLCVLDVGYLVESKAKLSVLPYPSSSELNEETVALCLLHYCKHKGEPVTGSDISCFSCVQSVPVADVLCAVGDASVMELAFNQYIDAGGNVGFVDGRIMETLSESGSTEWALRCLDLSAIEPALSRLSKLEIIDFFATEQLKARLTAHESLFGEFVRFKLWLVVLSKFQKCKQESFCFLTEFLGESAIANEVAIDPVEIKQSLMDIGKAAFDVIQRADRSLEDEAAAFLYRDAVELVPLFLQAVAPGDVCEWSSTSGQGASWERTLVEHGVASSLIRAEVTNNKYKNENLKSNFSMSSRLLVCSYSSHGGEIQAELTVRFPDSWPLRLGQVEASPVVGLSKGKNARLKVSIQSVFRLNGVQNAVQIWIENIEGFLKDVEECYICYSVTYHHGASGTAGSIPSKQCRTCKYKFHSECLLKYFRTSGKTICCLCQNPF